MPLPLQWRLRLCPPWRLQLICLLLLLHFSPYYIETWQQQLLQWRLCIVLPLHHVFVQSPHLFQPNDLLCRKISWQCQHQSLLFATFRMLPQWFLNVHPLLLFAVVPSRQILQHWLVTILPALRDYQSSPMYRQHLRTDLLRRKDEGCVRVLFPKPALRLLRLSPE